MHLHARHNVISTHITISPFAIRVLHSCRIAAPVYLSILLTGTSKSSSRLGLIVSRACPLLVACGLVRLRLLGRSRICIVLINTSCEENYESQAHGYGRVPAPAAVRLLTSRPLLPSASAAGIPRCHGNGGLLDGARSNMPWRLCRWPLHMAARAWACSRSRFGWRDGRVRIGKGSWGRARTPQPQD